MRTVAKQTGQRIFALQVGTSLLVTIKVRLHSLNESNGGCQLQAITAAYKPGVTAAPNMHL
jgi:hypothetical protein